MTDLSRYRVYDASECGDDGYPIPWNCSVDGFLPIKDEVRATAGHRCQRCGHPYRTGEHGNGEWSPCDERCDHGGPLRWIGAQMQWRIVEDRDPTGRMAQDVAAAQRFGWAEAQWRILTVHHLTGEKRDCRFWNLVPLCQRDHLEIQGRVQMHRPWPWEHSEWMKPYVAGFYGWKYGGEELSREQVEDRLEELLDLGRREESVERMPL